MQSVLLDITTLIVRTSVFIRVMGKSVKKVATVVWASVIIDMDA